MSQYKNLCLKSILHHLLFKEMNLKLACHFIQVTLSQAISFYTHTPLSVLQSDKTQTKQPAKYAVQHGASRIFSQILNQQTEEKQTPA